MRDRSKRNMIELIEKHGGRGSGTTTRQASSRGRTQTFSMPQTGSKYISVEEIRNGAADKYLTLEEIRRG